MKEIKELPAWAKVTGLLTIIYVALFQLPSLWETLTWTWRQCIMAHLEIADIMSILFGVIMFILELAGVVIWILSVYLSGLGFMNTKKKAYAFLLAYLLLCTLTPPLSYVSKKISFAYSQHQIQNMPKHQAELTEQIPRLVVKRNLSIPIGPVLLLLAIWFMCKSDKVRMPNRVAGD